jgi:drug/metabolite transporter (DMT)-like permease
MPYLYMVITLATMVAAQILLRKGMVQVGEFPSNLGGIVPFFLKTFVEPYVLIGILCVLISALSWIVAVSRAEISRIYPFMGLTFAFVALFSWLILGESLTPWRWAGIGLITLGVFLVLGIK